MDEDTLDALKKKKLQEKMQQGEDSAEAQQEQLRQQVKQLASQILTKEARSRLGNLRTAKPELASQIELQLVQLHRAGQINGKITDEQLKDLLQRIRDSDTERDIKYTTRG